MTRYSKNLERPWAPGYSYGRAVYTTQVFFKENVRNPVWICADPISLILGTRFSLISETRFEILGTRIGSLRRLKKTCNVYANVG